MEPRLAADVARRLFEDGVAVVPMLSAEELRHYHAGFRAAQRAFPEYTPEARVYVRGGFGAFGNPASFHNPLVRALRTRAMFAAVPVFRAYEVLRSNMRDVDDVRPTMRVKNGGGVGSAGGGSGTGNNDAADDSERTDTEDEGDVRLAGVSSSAPVSPSLSVVGGGGDGGGAGNNDTDDSERTDTEDEGEPESKEEKKPATRRTPGPGARPKARAKSKSGGKKEIGPEEAAAREEAKRMRVEKKRQREVAAQREKCRVAYPRNECDPRRTYSRYLSQLFDRMSERKAGGELTAETWHRDQAPECDAQADIFGGWVNLDLHAAQYFSAVPGTHRLARTSRQNVYSTSSSSSSASSADVDDPIAAGFSRIGPHETALYEENKIEIEVPPGSWIVFNQSLVHEVRKTASRAKYDSIRVYLGFRLGVCRRPLFPIDRVIVEQAVPPLPSGQRPPMYAQLAWLGPASRANIAEWSRVSFRPRVLETKTVVTGKLAGTAYRVVPQHMPSLLALDLPLYDGYTTAERSLLMPRRTWRLASPELDRQGVVSRNASGAKKTELRMSARPVTLTPLQQRLNQIATRRLLTRVRALRHRRALAQNRDVNGGDDTRPQTLGAGPR